MLWPVGQSPPDDRTRKVSWDMVRRTAAPRADERLLNVSTKCSSRDELVARFSPFVSQDSLRLPVRESWKKGDKALVQVSLTDGSRVLIARGEITDVRAAGAGAADVRPVVRVKLLEMDEESQLLFLRLQGQAPPHTPAPHELERTVVPVGDEPGPSASPSVPPPVPHHLASRRLPSRLPTPPPPRSRSTAPTAPPPPPSFPQAKEEASTPTPRALRLSPSSAASRAAPAPGSTARVAGSPFKLPANPLAELNPDAVKSFVDLNLYEADGEAPPLPDEEEASRRPGEAAVGGGAAGGLGRVPDEVPAGLPLTPAEGVEQTDHGSLRRLQAMFAAFADRLPPAVRRTLLQAMPFAFCTMLGWCVGFNMGGVEPGALRARRASTPAEAPAAGRAPPATSAPPETGEAAAPAAPVERVAGPSIAPLEPEPPVEPAPAPPAAAPAGCTARVDTRPGDVAVSWAGRRLGVTPLALEVPCGPALLTLERDRWAPISRRVVAKPGETVVVEERMVRPTSRLQVSSTPPGAAVLLNGRVMGKTPTTISVQRFERLQVELRLGGHRPWKNNLYLKEPQRGIEATLSPAKGK